MLANIVWCILYQNKKNWLSTLPFRPKSPHLPKVRRVLCTLCVGHNLLTHPDSPHAIHRKWNTKGSKRQDSFPQNATKTCTSKCSSTNVNKNTSEPEGTRSEETNTIKMGRIPIDMCFVDQIKHPPVQTVSQNGKETTLQCFFCSSHMQKPLAIGYWDWLMSSMDANCTSLKYIQLFAHLQLPGSSWPCDILSGGLTVWHSKIDDSFCSTCSITMPVQQLWRLGQFLPTAAKDSEAWVAWHTCKAKKR